jgi:hypothetical protein
MLRLALASLFLLPVPPALARGPRLEIRGQEPRSEVAGEGSYVWLRPRVMLELEAVGPAQVGLRVRQVLPEDREGLPVDLTVVRDDQEQGTVRFRAPPPDGQRAVGLGALSGPILVRLDVPAGPHVYRLLVSGDEQGILLQPYGGDLQSAAVVATPGREVVREPVTRPRPRPRSSPAPRAEPPEELAALEAGRRPALDFEGRAFMHEPAPTGAWNRGFWASAGLAGVLLVGGTGAFAAGGLLASAARSEPVQIAANERLDQAERAYRAGGALYGLAGAALIAALVLYALSPEEITLDPPDGAGLGLRF